MYQERNWYKFSFGWQFVLPLLQSDSDIEFRREWKFVSAPSPYISCYGDSEPKFLYLRCWSL